MLAAAGPFLLRNWKLVGIGLLCLLLAVQAVIISSKNNQIEKRDIRINELVGELKRISDAKNEQAERTEVNIEKAENGRKRSETIAKRIEEAPTAPNCGTPPEVIGADIWAE